jgi:hypothetical protein
MDSNVTVRPLTAADRPRYTPCTFWVDAPARGCGSATAAVRQV